jgi:hypothetical protein
MRLSIERVNARAARLSLAGWFGGLAYFNWFNSAGVDLSPVGHIILVGGGMIVAILIGLAVALIMGAITKAATGRTDGSIYSYMVGAIISPVLTFFAARGAIDLVALFS